MSVAEKKFEICLGICFGQDLFLCGPICVDSKCSEYISPEGSKEYLDKLDKDKKHYQTKFYNFEYSNYTQKSIKFIKGASIIDVFFNLGSESYSYIAKNFIVKT